MAGRVRKSLEKLPMVLGGAMIGIVAVSLLAAWFGFTAPVALQLAAAAVGMFMLYILI